MKSLSSVVRCNGHRSPSVCHLRITVCPDVRFPNKRFFFSLSPFGVLGRLRYLTTHPHTVVQNRCAFASVCFYIFAGTPPYLFSAFPTDAAPALLRVLCLCQVSRVLTTLAFTTSSSPSLYTLARSSHLNRVPPSPFLFPAPHSISTSQLASLFFFSSLACDDLFFSLTFLFSRFAQERTIHDI